MISLSLQRWFYNTQHSTAIRPHHAGSTYVLFNLSLGTTGEAIRCIWFGEREVDNWRLEHPQMTFVGV